MGFGVGTDIVSSYPLADLLCLGQSIEGGIVRCGRCSLYSSLLFGFVVFLLIMVISFDDLRGAVKGASGLMLGGHSRGFRNANVKIKIALPKRRCTARIRSYRIE